MSGRPTTTQGQSLWILMKNIQKQGPAARSMGKLSCGVDDKVYALGSHKLKIYLNFVYKYEPIIGFRLVSCDGAGTHTKGMPIPSLTYQLLIGGNR